MQGTVRAFAVVAALAAVPAATYDGMREFEECAPGPVAQLHALGIADAARAATYYVIETTGPSVGVETGVSAWTRLKSCRSGYVVVSMDLECRPKQTYTFGDCRVPGIPPG